MTSDIPVAQGTGEDIGQEGVQEIIDCIPQTNMITLSIESTESKQDIDSSLICTESIEAILSTI